MKGDPILDPTPPRLTGQPAYTVPWQMEDSFETAVAAHILGEFDRAGLVDGIDDGFERDGAETDAIIRPIEDGSERNDLVVVHF